MSAYKLLVAEKFRGSNAYAVDYKYFSSILFLWVECIPVVTKDDRV